MSCTSNSGRACLRGALAFVLLANLSACVHRYRAQGVVLAVDRANHTVTISHRAIPGYMPAMAMPFPVKTPQELNDLVPGARVKFRLEVGKHGTLARHIAVQPAVGLEDVPLPKPVDKVAIGNAVPDFTLTDQRGASVRLSDFRGRLVAIDFIYTRCPLPDVCPRLSANFARLQKHFSGKIVLLSVTLDPQYDTPQVLAEYGRRWQANPDTWRLLTGSDRDIQTIAGHFGLVYWPEEGLITHQSATALVTPEGKLCAMLEGSSFTSQQLLDLVQVQLPSSPTGSQD